VGVVFPPLFPTRRRYLDPLAGVQAVPCGTCPFSFSPYFPLARQADRPEGITKSSPQERQAILDYRLTLTRANQLIPAMEAMTKYLVSLPDLQDRMARWMKMTPAQRLTQVEKDPKAMAILKMNNLTAREYVVGVPALRMALMAAQGATSSAVIASPAHVAFAKANLAQLKPKMDAADGISGRRWFPTPAGPLVPTRPDKYSYAK